MYEIVHYSSMITTTSKMTENNKNKTKNTDEKSPLLYSWNGWKTSIKTPTTGFTTQNCRVAYKQYKHSSSSHESARVRLHLVSQLHIQWQRLLSTTRIY